MSIIPASSPWGASIRRRKSNYKPQPWHQAEYDSEVEASLWCWDYQWWYMYGSQCMLSLSGITKSKSKSGEPAAIDEKASKVYPAIILLLTATKDDQGKPRKTSTLTMVAEDGLFKAGLRDRENETSLWKSARSMDGVLKAIEEALVSGEAEWRAQAPSRK